MYSIYTIVVQHDIMLEEHHNHCNEGEFMEEADGVSVTMHHEIPLRSGQTDDKKR